MRILSIDWDYFIDATATERAALMPDGGNENLPWGIQSTIWVNHYAKNMGFGGGKLGREHLIEVPIRRTELIDLRTLLAATVTKKTRVYIAESHADIFNPVKCMTREFTEEFELINIDHHHDCYGYGIGANSPVDCGNWLNKVIEQSHDNAHVNWVKNPDSEEWRLGDLTPVTLRQIDHRQPFDMVFLCRSGMWSPPHLDKHFLVLSQYLNKRCKGQAIHTAKTTREDRWTKTFRDNIKSMERAVEAAKAQMAPARKFHERRQARQRQTILIADELETSPKGGEQDG